MSAWKFLFAALTGLFAWLTWHNPFLSLTIFFGLLTFVGDGPPLVVKQKVAAIAGIIMLAGAIPSCRNGEQPGPSPEPTPDLNAAVCRVEVPHGTPPECRNADRTRVPCPSGYESLPICP